MKVEGTWFNWHCFSFLLIFVPFFFPFLLRFASLFLLRRALNYLGLKQTLDALNAETRMTASVHCHANILPNTGQGNNLDQLKNDK